LIELSSALDSGYVIRDEFHFDILRAISEPLDSLSGFKESILNCFLENLNTSNYEFASYQPSARQGNSIEMCDFVSLNVAQPFYGDEWLDEFFDSCLYNPNHNPIFLNSDRSVFKLSDFISYQEYEKNKNFKELIEPHGYYHTAVAFLKRHNSFVGQITFLRRKDEGDFSEEEIKAVESVAPFITNRLLDYNALNQATIYKDVFFDTLCDSNEAVLLLDKNLRVIASNDQANEFCGNILAQDGLPSFYVQKVVDKVFCCGAEKKKCFSIVARDGKTYYFTIRTYNVSNVNRFQTVYLVYISRNGYVKGSAMRDSEKKIRAGDSRLTGRQREIVNLIAAGMTNAEIAQHLLISENTVRKHIENIRLELGVSNRIAILNELNLL